MNSFSMVTAWVITAACCSAPLLCWLVTMRMAEEARPRPSAVALICWARLASWALCWWMAWVRASVSALVGISRSTPRWVTSSESSPMIRASPVVWDAAPLRESRA